MKFIYLWLIILLSAASIFAQAGSPGMINVRSVSTYDSFPAAITAIGTDTVTLIIDILVSWPQKDTSGQNITLLFVNEGGVSSVDDSCFIFGPIIAGDNQIFYDEVPIIRNNTINPIWFGADRTATVSSALAFQKCLLAIGYDGWGHIHVPRGTYIIDDTLKAERIGYLKLTGEWSSAWFNQGIGTPSGTFWDDGGNKFGSVLLNQLEDGVILDLGVAVFNSGDPIVIENINFVNDTSETKTGTGLIIRSRRHIVLRDLGFAGFVNGTAIKYDGQWQGATIQDVYMFDCRYGIMPFDDDANWQGSNIIGGRYNSSGAATTGIHDGGDGEATVMTDSGEDFTVDGLIGLIIFNTTDNSWGTITDNDATTITVDSLTGGTNDYWDDDDVFNVNTLFGDNTGYYIRGNGNNIFGNILDMQDNAVDGLSEWVVLSGSSNTIQGCYVESTVTGIRLEEWGIRGQGNRIFNIRMSADTAFVIENDTSGSVYGLRDNLFADNSVGANVVLSDKSFTKNNMLRTFGSDGSKNGQIYMLGGQDGSGPTTTALARDKQNIMFRDDVKFDSTVTFESLRISSAVGFGETKRYGMSPSYYVELDSLAATGSPDDTVAVTILSDQTVVTTQRSAHHRIFITRKSSSNEVCTLDVDFVSTGNNSTGDQRYFNVDTLHTKTMTPPDIAIFSTNNAATFTYAIVNKDAGAVDIRIQAFNNLNVLAPTMAKQ